MGIAAHRTAEPSRSQPAWAAATATTRRDVNREADATTADLSGGIAAALALIQVMGLLLGLFVRRDLWRGAAGAIPELKWIKKMELKLEVDRSPYHQRNLINIGSSTLKIEISNILIDDLMYYR